MSSGDQLCRLGDRFWGISRGLFSSSRRQPYWLYSHGLYGARGTLPEWQYFAGLRVVHDVTPNLFPPDVCGI